MCAPSYLQQFALPRVGERREHLLVFFNSNLQRDNSRVGISSSYSHAPPSLLILGAIGGTRLGVELVDDEVTEGGFEEVLLGTVFQQGVVHRGGSHLQAAKQKIHQRAARCEPPSAPYSSYLLVDLDGLLVLLQLGAVGPDLQQTLVGRTEGGKK